MNKQCIIFDCDGVLVDSEAISMRVLCEMAEEIGLVLDQATAIEYFTGQSLAKILGWLETAVGQPLAPTFEKEFRTRSFALFQTELKAIPGVEAVLKSMQVPICVASSGPPEKIRLNLETTQLLHYFEGNIFSSYEIGSWKPAPDIFEYAAETMGFAPKDCAVIEDSLVGIAAARSGGFQVYGYTQEDKRDAYEAAGAIVFTEMQQLLSLL